MAATAENRKWDVVSELKTALRTVFRSPRYSFSVALILALGNGANSLVFSIIFAVGRNFPVARHSGTMTRVLHK
jgi:hypothetical protein